jgi:hypothetical protein
MEQELQLAERAQQSLAPKGLSWSDVSVEAPLSTGVIDWR